MGNRIATKVIWVKPELHEILISEAKVDKLTVSDYIDKLRTNNNLKG